MTTPPPSRTPAILQPLRHLGSRSYLAALAILISVPCKKADAELIAGWDFQGSITGTVGTKIAQPPNTPRIFESNAGTFQPISFLYMDGTNGSSAFLVSDIDNNSTLLGALNSITANTDGTPLSTAGGVGSLALFHRESIEGGVNGKSAVFKFSMSGYEDLLFSFAIQRPNDSTNTNNYGVNTFTFTYSFNGTEFFPWATIDTGAGSVINTAFSIPTALDAVNNASDVYLRMTVSGATGFNSTRIDNIQLNATAVPEPSLGAMLFAGTIGLLGRRRKRC